MTAPQTPPAPGGVPLEEVLAAMGCPRGQCAAMASQLERRADQLAAAKGRTRDEALRHLLGLMSQGWAAAAGRGR